jgi:hypothetical protein
MFERSGYLNFEYQNYLAELIPGEVEGSLGNIP